MAPDLPIDDDTAGWNEYASVVADAIGERTDLIVVAQSMGGFTAPLVAARRPVRLIVLTAAMVPQPGESAGEWFTNTGWQQAKQSADERDGRDPAAAYDPLVSFFHDVPANVTAAAMERGTRNESPTPFQQPWPLTAWPDTPNLLPAWRPTAPGSGSCPSQLRQARMASSAASMFSTEFA